VHAELIGCAAVRSGDAARRAEEHRGQRLARAIGLFGWRGSRMSRESTCRSTSASPKRRNLIDQPKRIP